MNEQQTGLEEMQAGNARYNGTVQSNANEYSISEMMDNMGEPKPSVECPVTDCQYDGEVSSVASHISGKRDRKHDWENTDYEGYHDFVESDHDLKVR